MSADPARTPPTQADVDWLIETAERHPFGVDYLLNGHLGTVAITFGCHAFTVVAARDFLNAGPSRPAARSGSPERVR